MLKADRSGEVEAVVESDKRAIESDWAPDGSFIIYRVAEGETEGEFWLASVGADSAHTDREQFLTAPYELSSPQISPDARFVAYCSNESGSFEVYVRQFPTGEDRWQVSERGGGQPRWSHDGRRLYYVEGDTLVEVEVDLRGDFRAGQVQRLFTDSSLEGVTWDFDVSSTGSFVMIEDLSVETDPASRSAIHITQNWDEEFRDRE